MVFIKLTPYCGEYAKRDECGNVKVKFENDSVKDTYQMISEKHLANDL